MRLYKTLKEKIINLTEDVSKNGVYRIYHESKPGIFYIGSTFRNHSKSCKKGIYGRWIEHYSQLKNNIHHSKYLQNVCNKYFLEGLRFELLEVCLSEELCRNKESYYINFYNSYKNGYNMSENVYHPTATLKQRQESSQRMRLNNPMKNKDVAKRMVESKKGYVNEVLQYDIQGNFIKEYENIQIASSDLKIHESNILRSLNEKTKKSAGYLWFYKVHFTEEYLISKINKLKETYKPTRKSIEQGIEKLKKSIIQKDLQGNIIKEFNSLKDASEFYQIDSGNISKACSKKYKTYKGYIWDYKNCG